jgi:hypothetical protein
MHIEADNLLPTYNKPNNHKSICFIETVGANLVGTLP